MSLGFTGREKAGKVMGEFYHHKLHHGSTGEIVTDPQVAKAIAMSEGRKAQSKVMKHHSPEVDEHAVTELHLYADNESSIYPQKQAIVKNLARKMGKGTYDATKAAKLWDYWVTAAAKKYIAEFSKGAPMQAIFPASVRREVAKQVERDMHSEVQKAAESIAASRAPRKRTEAEQTLLAHGSSSRFPALIKERRAAMATRKRHVKKHSAKHHSALVGKPKVKRGRPKKHHELGGYTSKKEQTKARRRTQRKTHKAAHHAAMSSARPAGYHKHNPLAKVASLASDIKRAVTDLTKAEHELHEAQKLIRSVRAPKVRTKKHHHHAKARTGRISTSRAIALASK